MAKTGDRVSSLAGGYADITGEYLALLIKRGEADELARDIRSMAASLLRQDEHRGIRGKLKKLLGG